ncbi:Rieske (2Fe-2S) protein [bacterium]|nr:MAG: Rieske (2Fe-2S) protein [bacterium]
MTKAENRVDQIVSDLLHGRRLKLRGGDAEEKAAITAAARLAAARQGPQRMRPAFRRRLAQSLGSAPHNAWLTRRAALVAGIGLAVGAATGGLVSRAMEGTSSPQRPGGAPISPMNARWVDVAALEDLVDGQGKRVSAGAVSAYLFRHGATVTAVSSICSHLPCELQWNSGAGLLDCPCHPASFTPNGQSTYAYPLPALDTVGVRVTAAGRVEVLGTAE